MKVVDVRKAEAIFVRPAEVEVGEEIIFSREGKPIAKLIGVEVAPRREAGSLRSLPEWQDFTYEPAVFAPLSDDELIDEGWPA